MLGYAYKQSESNQGSKVEGSPPTKQSTRSAGWYHMGLTNFAIHEFSSYAT